ncbi:MAG: hypothetical protein ACYDAC_01530 [Candidatus Dormibacteria bacterium]
MTMTAKSAFLLSITMVTVAACGPSSSLEVSVRSVNQNLRLGNQVKAVPAPAPSLVPGINLMPGSPAFIGPPIPIGGFASGGEANVLPSWLPPAPLPCPEPTAGAVPAEPIGSHADQPPSAGTYRFRDTGSYVVGALSGAWPESFTRTVSQPYTTSTSGTAGQGSLGSGSQPNTSASQYFDVVERSISGKGELIQTTTTFGLVPGRPPAGSTGSVPPPSPSMAYGEIDVFRVTTEYMSGGRNGQKDDFTPSPAIQLVSFPIHEGDTFAGSGTDPLTQTRMQIVGTVKSGSGEGQVDVNACGSLVASWKVDVDPTQSYIAGPVGTSCYSIGGYFDIAPQYGGMIVEMQRALTGGISSNTVNCDTSSATYVSNDTATIDSMIPSTP